MAMMDIMDSYKPIVLKKFFINLSEAFLTYRFLADNPLFPYNIVYKMRIKLDDVDRIFVVVDIH
jgi:hypothetical protein